ncbi:hypothetical protein BRADI_3g24715v3 [Brachypodium distachyon]|uniref:Uncharacterized protein n=1 Tax=Brachypodium distachyon TaxID=15368 RepID=A0A2K2CZ66_BRADI|nr:hypothetical protein BRADI_3g24715v3 [Brachypodium distachyon]
MPSPSAHPVSSANLVSLRRMPPHTAPPPASRSTGGRPTSPIIAPLLASSRVCDRPMSSPRCARPRATTHGSSSRRQRRSRKLRRRSLRWPQERGRRRPLVTGAGG